MRVDTLPERESDMALQRVNIAAGVVCEYSCEASQIAHMSGQKDAQEKITSACTLNSDVQPFDKPECGQLREVVHFGTGYYSDTANELLGETH